MNLFVSDVWAQEAPIAAGDTQTGTVDAPIPDVSAEKMLMDNLMILGLLFFIFYFMLIRPQQKRLKDHQEMVKALAKGDKVITSGGIIGTVSKFEGDDVVVVEIAPEVKVRVARSSVTEKMGAKGTEKTANDN